jgi:HAMP domain-containing protein
MRTMNNPIIITIIIATAGFILSVFSANWLNQRHIDKLMDRLDRQMTAQFETVNTRIGALEQRLDRFERQTEQHFGRIERQLDAIFKPAIPPRP